MKALQLILFLLIAGSLMAAPRAAFEQHCFKCHDATQAEGDLDLEAVTSKKSDATSVTTLEDIIMRIREGDMPPKKSKQQPDAAQRAEMITWAQQQIDALAEETMDDPGVIVMPRLTRHEYRNVIRDLSGGVIMNAGEYLPNEGGAGEGFSNVGAAQGMGTAQFEKYIEAAKGVLRHLRVSPHDGLVWSTLPHEPVDDHKAVIRETTDDIIAWYIGQQQKWGAEHREALAAKYGNAHVPYLMAAKRGGGDGTLCATALAKWQRILVEESPQSPFADWAKAWRALPANLSDEKLHAECLAIVTGKRGGSTEVNKEDFAPAYEISFHETREEVLEAATKDGHWPFRIDIGDAKQLFLIVTDAGDGGRGEYAVWQRGRIVFKDGSTKPWQEAVKLVGANSGKAFNWGMDGENAKTLATDAIGVRPPGALKFAVPKDAIVFEVDLTLDKKRTKVASIQSLVLKEKPKSQSYIPGRFVFGGKKRGAETNQADNKERDQLLRKRNIAEANLTKMGLNAERNVFAEWKRTPLGSIGGPWPDQTAEIEEPNAPYHYTTAQIRGHAKPEDLTTLGVLEDRLFSLTQPWPDTRVVLPRLRNFARQAWRRSVTDDEAKMLNRLFTSAAKEGASFDNAMKVPLLAVLLSPNFLHRDADTLVCSDQNETVSNPTDKSVYLTSNTLATRLSFFLWASIPDTELLTADLSKPEELKKQASRMLKDPRAESVATNFAAQVWGFDDFENFTGPDEKRFPEFTSERRREMLVEVIAALNRVFMYDEPITRLLEEDCLATKPLFLTKTSLPLRTSPVQRGAWVVETLLGRRIPPPPPNVPKLSEDSQNSDGLTIHQQLAKHREEANCAACHAKIDPPGIALENYDPIGRWRTDANARAVWQDGSVMDGASGLRQWLRSRQDEFLANLHRKLLGYALGRAVQPGDKRLLERMKSSASDGPPRFSTLVQLIITSPQFTTRQRL